MMDLTSAGGGNRTAQRPQQLYPPQRDEASQVRRLYHMAQTGYCTKAHMRTLLVATSWEAREGVHPGRVIHLMAAGMAARQRSNDGKHCTAWAKHNPQTRGPPPLVARNGQTGKHQDTVGRQGRHTPWFGKGFWPGAARKTFRKAASCRPCRPQT